MAVPPDLDRLGDALAAAAARSIAARRARSARRRRAATAVVASLVAFPALSPTGLGPAERVAQGEPPGCDRPHGHQYTCP